MAARIFTMLSYHFLQRSTQHALHPDAGTFHVGEEGVNGEGRGVDGVRREGVVVLASGGGPTAHGESQESANPSQGALPAVLRLALGVIPAMLVAAERGAAHGSGSLVPRGRAGNQRSEWGLRCALWARGRAWGG